MAVAMIGPKFYAWDRNGKPLAFGKLYTYQARTNIPKPTYQSEDQEVENTNPVILNGEGYADIYLDGSYKMVLKDDKDNEIWSSDPVTSAQPDEWVNCQTATYLSPTSFKVSGNKVDDFDPGRRVRLSDNTQSYSYSTVETATFASGETVITIIDGFVTTGLQQVCLSIVGVESFSSNSVVTFKTLEDSVGAAVDSKVIREGDNIIVTERTPGNGGGGLWEVVETSSVTPNGYNIVQSSGKPDLSFSLVIDNDTVNVAQLGAVDDGDIGPIFDAAIATNPRKVIFPNIKYSGSIILNNYADLAMEFLDGAIVTSVGSTQVLAIKDCQRVSVKGGEFTSEERVTRPVAITDCNFVDIFGIKAYFKDRSTYSGAAIYNTAAIMFENAIRCTATECELYNMEGFGLAIIGTGNGNKVRNCYIHDNVGGILNNGNDNNFNSFTDNDIGFNNVSPGSGNDGILVNATDIDNASGGHLITNNRIYNNGEHGMYMQAGNTNISDNRVYSNAEGGIKVAKCRNVNIVDNVIYDNESSIQVQSGFEDILIQGNICRLATGSFDLDFTWNTSLDPFGGRNVKIIGNYFLSDVDNWSMDIDGTEGIFVEGNSCAKGIIYSANATPVGYQNVTIKDNEFLDGVIRVVRCQAPIITGNRAKSLFANSTNSEIEMEGNVFNDVTLSARKDIALQAFKSIVNNTINSSVVEGSPIFEIFNGQDADTVALRCVGNKFKTAGAIVLNVNGSGISMDDSIIANNIFDVGPGATAVSIVGVNCVINGNVDIKGTQILTNSIATSNTGGGTFNGTGNQVANNI